MKRKKFLLNLKVNFSYNLLEIEDSVELLKLGPLLGQYNIRDNSNDFPNFLKSFFLDLLYKFPKKKLLKNNQSFFLSNFLIPISIFFEDENDSIILIHYPNFNFNLKKIITLRNKEFFFKLELFKLCLLSFSSKFINEFINDDDLIINKFLADLPIFSYNFFFSSTKSISGILLSFRKHLIFKARKINFRRKSRETDSLDY